MSARNPKNDKPDSSGKETQSARAKKTKVKKKANGPAKRTGVKSDNSPQKNPINPDDVDKWKDFAKVNLTLSKPTDSLDSVYSQRIVVSYPDAKDKDDKFGEFHNTKEFHDWLQTLLSKHIAESDGARAIDTRSDAAMASARKIQPIDFNGTIQRVVVRQQHNNGRSDGKSVDLYPEEATDNKVSSRNPLDVSVDLAVAESMIDLDLSYIAKCVLVDAASLKKVSVAKSEPGSANGEGLVRLTLDNLHFPEGAFQLRLLIAPTSGVFARPVKLDGLALQVA